MKWKSFLFCLSLLIPINTNAFQDVDGKYTGNKTISEVSPKPSTPSTNPSKKISTIKKVVKVGGTVKVINHVRKHKLLYAAGAAVVGTAAFIQYQNDIDRIIDKHFYAKGWRSEKKSKLVPILYKKIKNAKPEKQPIVIMAIKDSLKYYMVMHNNEPFGKLATDIADSLHLLDDEYKKEVQMSLSEKEEAHFLLTSSILKVRKEKPRPNCKKGSPERERIKLKQIYKTDADILSLWDVGAYGEQSKINKNNIINNKKYYGYHKDHIPSKRAVELFIQNRDNNNKVLNDDVITNIYTNATSVVLLAPIHRAGRTYGGKNIDISVADSTDLLAAMILDFETYYVMFADKGEATPDFRFKWLNAFTQTYIRNESLCLFERSKL